MTGSTTDISHICEFGWYDWVMFRDIVPTFPNVKLTLGRYLGPVTNVGSAFSLDHQNPEVKWTDCLQINPVASERQGDPLPYPPGNAQGIQ